MPNLHSGGPDTVKEIQSICGDLLPACLLTHSGLTPPGSGLTLSAVSVQAYARHGTDLVYITQPAISVTVPNVAGSHWLIAFRDTHSTVAGWTRRAGSHLLTQQAATQPTIPDGAVLVAQITVAGGNITAVSTDPAFSPPLSRQTADAVAITDGRIALGGHAPTGVLDVQGSVNIGGDTYPGLRLWPVAPAAAAQSWGVSVEAATGAGLAGAQLRGFRCNDQPTMASVIGLESLITAGTNRWNIYAPGTAQNSFGGNVGVKTGTPAYELDVTGAARVTGQVGIGSAPVAGVKVQLKYPRTGGLHGLFIQPTDSDTAGGLSVGFLNVAGTVIGSITTNATATAFNTSSDARLKFGVTTLTDALARVQRLRPVTFRWNADDSADAGFLAHELMTVVPQAVSGLPDEVHPDGTVKPQQVDASKLVVWLVGAVQELAQRLQTLEEQLGI